MPPVRMIALGLFANVAQPLLAQAQESQKPSISEPANSAMTCQQIASELTALTGGAVANADRSQELSKINSPKNLAGEALANQAVGALLNMLPNAAASAATTALGTAEAAADKAHQKKVDQAIIAQADLDERQADMLDRMLELHELHESKCAVPALPKQ